MPRCVYYVGTSADGFIADSSGGVKWLEAHFSPDLGFHQFIANVGAVVLGRRTFDQIQGYGKWPYGETGGILLTSRPVGSLPSGLVAVNPLELSAALAQLRASTAKDVWVVGGGDTARACLECGQLTEIECFAVPHLLGTGVPMFGNKPLDAKLTLIESKQFNTGTTMRRYRVGAG